MLEVKIGSGEFNYAGNVGADEVVVVVVEVGILVGVNTAGERERPVRPQHPMQVLAVLLALLEPVATAFFLGPGQRERPGRSIGSQAPNQHIRTQVYKYTRQKAHRVSLGTRRCACLVLVLVGAIG